MHHSTARTAQGAGIAHPPGRRAPHRCRRRVACAASADGADAASSATRRSALLLAAAAAAVTTTTTSTALPAAAAVQVPDPLFVKNKGGSPPPLVDALELNLPLRLVSLRGSVPAEALAGFKAALGKRGSGVVLQPRAQLGDIFDDLASPERAGPKSAATADAVTLGDEWLAAAVARSLVAPIPGATASPWWARLHPTWRRLVTRAADGSVDARSGAVYGAPYRWGATLLAARADRLRRAGVGVPGSWADLLHPRLAGRVALPASPRLFAALACAAAGVGFNPTPGDLEAALGSGRRGDRAASAVAALAATMAALRSSALLVSDRDAGRALAAGDAWVAVGASPDLGPLSARSAAVVLAAPAAGVPLWADLWCVPSLASSGGAGTPPGTPSPLLAPWLDYCLSSGRADAGRGFGAMAGGASPLVLPPSGVSSGGGGGGGGLFRRRRGKAAPPVPADATSVGLGPGGLPPPSTLARSSFLEPANELVREALRVAGEVQ